MDLSSMASQRLTESFESAHRISLLEIIDVRLFFAHVIAYALTHMIFM